MSTVNRTLLAVTGLLLVLGGALVLAGGLHLYSALDARLPSWWPLTSPHQPLISTASRTRWTHRVWWWPSVIAGLSLLLAGALAWLYAELRRTTPITVDLPADGVHLRLRGRALQDALETELATLPDVDRARVRLTAGPHRPLVRAALRIRPGASPAALIAQFHDGPLAQTRTSLGLPDLPFDLRLRVAAHAPEHKLR